MENDKTQTPEQKGKTDPFLNFMFGESMIRETSKEGVRNTQELPNKDAHPFLTGGPNWTNDRFLGDRRNDPFTGMHNSTQNQIENLLNNMDMELLMETIDMFVATSKQFKPIFAKIPLLKSIFK